MGIKAEPTFSLKDSLFNAATLAKLTAGIERAWPAFDRAGFEDRVLERFPELELKDRIRWIVEVLGASLPDDFDEARRILRDALPPPLDPSLTDDDFGHFIWVVPGEYVARYGCEVSHLDASLDFLREATKRFTAEGAIRPFLAAFPEKTMAFVRDCATDSNYHVRRLASEGIRPFLPWAARVVLPPDDVVAVLDTLHADPTRYVTRSVCNTLNDLSKSDPDVVLEALRRWAELGEQDAEELEWMTRHALRTLVKRDHRDALAMLGYSPEPAVRVDNIETTREVAIGDAFTWSCDLASLAKQRLRVALKIYFLKANGSLRPKVFAVKDVSVEPDETVQIKKRQPFKPITTRVLYPGVHSAELIVNGQVQARRDFTLLQP